jgi:hypothetical protein
MGEFSPAIEVQVTRLQIVAICGLLQATCSRRQTFDLQGFRDRAGRRQKVAICGLSGDLEKPAICELLPRLRLAKIDLVNGDSLLLAKPLQIARKSVLGSAV